MDNTIVFSVYRQGASHKPDKPCQDHARHLSSDAMDIIVLSDGHGGKKYFRSHYGAEIATEIAMETLKIFCAEVDFAHILGSADFLQVSTEEEAILTDKEIEYVMRHVFQHICSEWHRRIEEHFLANPLTGEERDFLSKESDKGMSLYDYYFDAAGRYIKNHLSSAYGCTLFGVAEIGNGYWVGFQIGDGKCVAFREDGTWFEPIPWDKNCFQNLTTSLSHYDAESFRYCIGRGLPAAIFIASDGMDDSYAPMPELAFEYVMRFLANLAINGESATSSKVGDWLDKISENYSRDDMSVGYIVQKSKIKNIIRHYISSIEGSLSSDREKSKEEVDNKNALYQQKNAEVDDTSLKIINLQNKLEELAEEGVKKSYIYEKNKEEIDQRRKGCKAFFNGLSTSVRSRLSGRKNKNIDFDERENLNQELNKEITTIKRQLEDIVQAISQKQAYRESLERDLPVLKKHVREATVNLEEADRKLNRISIVRRHLEELCE